MLQHLRERLTLCLVGLLPFHALLVTVGTKILKGPGHAPWGVLAVWKEGLLGVVLAVALVEILRKAISGQRLAISKFDLIDGLIFALMILGIFISLQSSVFSLLLGFKYDFLPLVAFLILRRIPWSEEFFSRVMKVLLVVGTIVAAYGILTFFLPQGFFAFLGYSDLHSLYLPNSPLPAFHQLGGSALRRIQGTMSGPNQMGLWLLIPLSVAVAKISGEKKIRVDWLISGLVMGVALVLTFSRSAWIGAIVIVIVAAFRFFPRKIFWNSLLGVSILGFLISIFAVSLAPNVLLRFSSSRDHFLRPLEAIQMIIQHPLGLGLGSAGPASNRVSDACVELEAGADSSWAADRPDLCVFVGGIQKQPLSRECHCPFLPENWYLQIGVEMGVAGFVLYLVLVLSVVRWFVARCSLLPFHAAAGFAFIGISIAALFLHAWEDAAVAYTVWVMVAAVFSYSSSSPVSRTES